MHTQCTCACLVYSCATVYTYTCTHMPHTTHTHVHICTHVKTHTHMYSAQKHTFFLDAVHRVKCTWCTNTNFKLVHNGLSCSCHSSKAAVHMKAVKANRHWRWWINQLGFWCNSHLHVNSAPVQCSEALFHVYKKSGRTQWLQHFLLTEYKENRCLWSKLKITRYVTLHRNMNLAALYVDSLNNNSKSQNSITIQKKATVL